MHNFRARFPARATTFRAVKRALETSRRPLLGTILALALIACAALPASASAGFNDGFADAVAHPEGTNGKDWVETFHANLGSATKETGEPNHAGFPGGHSVWISWHFYEDTDARADACGAKGADLLIAVYSGGAVNELTAVGSDSEESENGCVSVRFEAEEGSDYRIAVDAKSSPGTTSMNFSMGRYPANDDFADAIVLPEFPTSVDVDPGLGGTEPGEPAAIGAGNSTWYRWTAGKSGLVSINNCDNWPQLYATVFTGAALEELTQIAEPIANGGICDETRFEAEEGTTYSIRIAGFTGKGGEMSVDFGWVGKTLLTVSRTGSGSGTVASEPAGIECGASCEASFYRGPLDYGQIPIALTATPDPGSVFVGWSGEGWSGLTWSPQNDWGEPECGSEPVCEFGMFGTPTEVTAEFEEAPLLAISGGESRSDTLQSTPPPPAPAAAAAAPHALPSPHRRKPKCGKHRKGKKQAKAAKRRRACKR
jgi:hypothetical protein